MSLACVAADGFQSAIVCVGFQGSERPTIAWMGEKVMPFLEENDMVGTGRARKLWRASFLLP